jgi:hypothetical protein
MRIARFIDPQKKTSTNTPHAVGGIALMFALVLFTVGCNNGTKEASQSKTQARVLFKLLPMRVQKRKTSSALGVQPVTARR